MWLAVIIGVCLAVEFLSYISGGELRINKKSDYPNETSLKTHP
jgi:hypothetical protein